MTTSGSPLNDAEDLAPLIERIKDGDERAFETLVDLFSRQVYHFCYRFLGNEADAEEAVQEVFIRIHRSIARYEPRAKFSTWLFTIAKNVCLNMLRSRKGGFVSLDDEEELGYREIPSSWGDPEKAAESRQFGSIVAEAVRNLPEGHRMAVILCKYHGMKYAEAAEIMGCTEGAVKLRIHRARAVLAESLKGLLDPETSAG